MSKTIEQKAFEEYPKVYIDKNIGSREGYAKGYNQAMQDFLEKAEKFFNSELYASVSDQICSVNNFTRMTYFVEQFKQYMQDEM